MRIYQQILACGLFFITISCQEQAIDQQAEAQKLMELSREWAITAQKDDLQKTLDYWDKDAILMSPGEPALKGHEEIWKKLKETEQISGFEISWEPKEAFVSKSGDLGYVIAQNHIQFSDSLGNTINMFGKGVEIWKKQEDGTWKNAVDIYNSDPSITSIK